MYISPVSKNLNFGHSFRVSICVKDANGTDNTFINPYSDEKLYKKLNSKIVTSLNEKYFDDLRKTIGRERKVKKSNLSNQKTEELVEKLKEIDSDYRYFNYARSVYEKGKLGYIATGIDVPILENIKGAKQIGIARADSFYTDGHTHNDYAKNMAKIYKQNALRYVKDTDNILRSENGKEIMLRAIFKDCGKNKNKTQQYELEDFEFYEIKNKPQLPQISPNSYYYKYTQKNINDLLKMKADHAKSILAGN